MRDYLTIIRKLDFVDLFKYGHINVGYAIEFDGNIASHADDDLLFKKLTSWLGMYEYSFEYLILHFKAKDIESQCIPIDIRNVYGLYTFDPEAKKEMSISFDPRIQLQVSPWADRFISLQQQRTIEQGIRGVQNLWVIFELADEYRTKCDELITKDIIQEVFRELYANERPTGEQSLWTYLLRYERHSYYPKDMAGFFCDLIHVFCNYHEKKELDGEAAEKTDIYQLITACQDSKFSSLAEIVKTSKLGDLSRSAARSEFGVIAPLFLYLKNLFIKGKGAKLSEETISYAKEIGEFECAMAVYLLGIVLGYDKTYDIFYDMANLPIFKKSVAQETPSSVLEAEGSQETTEAQKSLAYVGRAQSQDLFDDTVSSSRPIKNEATDSTSSAEGRPLPQQWMYSGGGKKVSVRPAYNEEEIKKYRGEKYKQIRTFNLYIREAIRAQGFDPDIEESRLTKKRCK